MTILLVNIEARETEEQTQAALAHFFGPERILSTLNTLTGESLATLPSDFAIQSGEYSAEKIAEMEEFARSMPDEASRCTPLWVMLSAAELPQDNATYILTKDGELEFTDTGVEA